MINFEKPFSETNSYHQVEAPRCASPGHLRGLKVATLRLAQLVSSSENIQVLCTWNYWFCRPSNIWATQACPPTLAQSSASVLSVSHKSNASLDCTVVSDPPAQVRKPIMITCHSSYYQNVHLRKPISFYLNVTSSSQFSRWPGVVLLSTWRQKLVRWRSTPTTLSRERRPRLLNELNEVWYVEVNTWKFPSPLRNLLMQHNAILIQYAVEVKTYHSWGNLVQGSQHDWHL